MNAKVESNQMGIPCCINCVGMHPSEPITMVEAMNRIHNPQKLAASKIMSMDKLEFRKQYINKSCMLCGRTYDNEGRSDETWMLTAQRVKYEFQQLGITGISDADINKVVAVCRKSWTLLWKNRATIKPADAEKMTFCGRLALILTHAEESRMKRNTMNGGQPLNKGMLKL